MPKHGNAKHSDEEVIEAVRQFGINEGARRLGVRQGTLSERVKTIEERLHVRVRPPPQLCGYEQRHIGEHSAKITLDIDDGIMIVASDGHYWPGAPSTAHKALVQFCAGKHIGAKPKIFIYNGDSFDGAKISRHPPIGWESRPEVVNELDACKERMGELEDALPRNAERLWTLGNHDGRFETRLAAMAPEYARIHGFHLKDHFPEWRPCWATFVNDRPGGVVVKHRFKGGMHAPHNNTLWAGRSIVTGHLHSQKVQPITDYNSTRWGVDTGCIAYPYGPQFIHYTESNPLNWIAGFAVFTFSGGKLLPPELVSVWSHKRDEIVFRGKIIKV